jgi:hypothetical protein
MAAHRRFTNTALPDRDRLLESALGIAEEVGEMVNATTRDELLLEIGDVCWHIAQLCDLTGASFYHIWIGAGDGRGCDYHGEMQAAQIVASMVAGKVKKHAFKGQPLELNNTLYTLAAILTRCASHLNATMPQVWAANIAKLQARHPNGFTV